MKNMITKEQFKRYVEVQHGGRTNMFDLRNVEALSGLDRDDIKEIMKNYNKYAKLYPEVITEVRT